MQEQRNTPQAFEEVWVVYPLCRLCDAYGASIEILRLVELTLLDNQAGRGDGAISITASHERVRVHADRTRGNDATLTCFSSESATFPRASMNSG